MKIVIIEDEVFAARRLENMIKEFDSSMEIVAWLESVRDSVAWFSRQPEYDLIFLDIHLEDNLSFAIFQQVIVKGPVIFTTATDEMAIKAFATKGIDYLHKPIRKADLFSLLDRYKNSPGLSRYTIDANFFSDIETNN